MKIDVDKNVKRFVGIWVLHFDWLNLTNVLFVVFSIENANLICFFFFFFYLFNFISHELLVLTG